MKQYVVLYTTLAGKFFRENALIFNECRYRLFFRQDVLEGVRGVAPGCLHEKFHVKNETDT